MRRFHVLKGTTGFGRAVNANPAPPMPPVFAPPAPTRYDARTGLPLTFDVGRPTTAEPPPSLRASGRARAAVVYFPMPRVW